MSPSLLAPPGGGLEPIYVPEQGPVGAAWDEVVSPDEESWLNRVVEQLWDLYQLPDNWDSYGSPGITGEALRSATTVAMMCWLILKDSGPGPAVAPVPGGGLQLDLDRGGYSLEMEVQPDGSIVVLLEKPDGTIEEVPMDLKDDRLTQLLLSVLTD